jgi:hypothetical protein
MSSWATASSSRRTVLLGINELPITNLLRQTRTVIYADKCVCF